MKKIYLLIYIFVLTAGLVFGQKPGMAIKNASKNYLVGLNHDNQGVVESTITNVMLLKLYHPENDFSKISERLDELTINAPEKIIRLKAFVAANYLRDSQRFSWIKERGFDYAETFFQTYIAQLEETERGLERSSHLTISK